MYGLCKNCNLCRTFDGKLANVVIKEAEVQKFKRQVESRKNFDSLMDLLDSIVKQIINAKTVGEILGSLDEFGLKCKEALKVENMWVASESGVGEFDALKERFKNTLDTEKLREDLDAFHSVLDYVKQQVISYRKLCIPDLYCRWVYKGVTKDRDGFERVEFAEVPLKSLDHMGCGQWEPITKNLKED